MLGWHQFIKRIKPSAFNLLVQRRQNELTEQQPENKERFQAVDEAVDIISPLISVALVGVESGREQFRDQKSTLYDLLNIVGWRGSGPVVWVEIALALGYVYHSLHGGLSLRTNQLDLALSLARVKIPDLRTQGHLHVWKKHDFMGWSASLGGNCTGGWKYLVEAYDERKWEWLAPIFGDELEYRTSLVAYYMVLNIHELASRIASGQQDMLNVSSGFDLNVPLTFLSEDYSINQRAITMLRNQAELTQLWACLNVTREQMENSWEIWIRLAENQLWRMYEVPSALAIQSLSDIFRHFFEGL